MFVERKVGNQRDTTTKSTCKDMNGNVQGDPGNAEQGGRGVSEDEDGDSEYQHDEDAAAASDSDNADGDALSDDVARDLPAAGTRSRRSARTGAHAPRGRIGMYERHII